MDYYGFDGGGADDFNELDIVVDDDLDDPDDLGPQGDTNADDTDDADSDDSQHRAHPDADPLARSLHRTDEANARALSAAAIVEREAEIMGLIMRELSNLVHPYVLPTIDSREIKGGAQHLPSNDVIDGLRAELAELVMTAYPPKRIRRHHNRRRRHRPEAQRRTDIDEDDDDDDC